MVQLRCVAGIPLSVPPWVCSVSELGGERPKIRALHVQQLVQKLFNQNVFPTCIDNETYDGETKPPVETG